MRLTRYHYWRVLWSLGNLWSAGKNYSYPYHTVASIYAGLQAGAVPIGCLESDPSPQFDNWYKQHKGGTVVTGPRVSTPTFTMMKVIDSQRPTRMPDEVYDVSHKLNCDLHSHGNDSYYEFEIVAEPTKDEQGGGWVSNDEVRLLTDWLVHQGAEVGETVLVKHWW